MIKANTFLHFKDFREYHEGKCTYFSNLNTLYIILEAVAYWAATVGSLQAVFLMQFNLDSSPAMCIIKHMPPWRSVSEKDGLSSADLAVPPTEKRPNPKIRAFKTNKMSKLVKLSVRTSDVDDALAKNSRAVVTNSVSAIFSFYAKTNNSKIFYMKDFFTYALQKYYVSSFTNTQTLSYEEPGKVYKLL